MSYKFMNHHEATETMANAGLNPVLSIFISASFILTGTFLPHITTELYTIQIPVIVMQLLQIAFWATGAYFSYRAYMKSKSKK